jgi:hypothetical protein
MIPPSYRPGNVPSSVPLNSTVAGQIIYYLTRGCRGVRLHCTSATIAAMYSARSRGSTRYSRSDIDGGNSLETFPDRGTAYNSRSFTGNILFVGGCGSWCSSRTVFTVSSIRLPCILKYRDVEPCKFLISLHGNFFDF